MKTLFASCVIMAAATAAFYQRIDIATLIVLLGVYFELIVKKD